MTRRGEPWGNKALNILQLDHLGKETAGATMQNTVKNIKNRLVSLLREKIKNFMLTCISIPDIRHPILTARKDEVPTWCKSTVNPLSVVNGSSVFLYSQT